MAAPDLVKRYLALWFQLGKRVASVNGSQHWQPVATLHGDRYAPEFERCWQEMIHDYQGACYLEGTHQTLAELLSPAWDIVGCARCPIPIPMRPSGPQPDTCPCDDRPLWPNSDLPAPHAPLSSHDCLAQIRDRLASRHGDDAAR